MKKFRHLLFVVCAGFMCYGGVLAYNYATQTEDEKFMLANIEALTRAEGSITTWECNNRGDDPCRHYCGICKSEVVGTGKASGSHSCW